MQVIDEIIDISINIFYNNFILTLISLLVLKRLIILFTSRVH